MAKDISTTSSESNSKEPSLSFPLQGRSTNLSNSSPATLNTLDVRLIINAHEIKVAAPPLESKQLISTGDKATLDLNSSYLYNVSYGMRQLAGIRKNIEALSKTDNGIILTDPYYAQGFCTKFSSREMR